jgi:hypothetical protein
MDAEANRRPVVVCRHDVSVERIAVGAVAGSGAVANPGIAWTATVTVA